MSSEPEEDEDLQRFWNLYGHTDKEEERLGTILLWAVFGGVVAIGLAALAFAFFN